MDTGEPKVNCIVFVDDSKLASITVTSREVKEPNCVGDPDNTTAVVSRVIP
jgi:hypothetical protein